MFGLFPPAAVQKSKQSSGTVQKGKEQLLFLFTREKRYITLDFAEQP